MSKLYQHLKCGGASVGGLLAGLVLSACEPATSLDSIRSQGELVIITRNAPTTYYEGRDGTTGLEYDLTKAFAKHLGVKARFVVKDNVNEIIRALHRGEGHIAAAGLARTPVRIDQYLNGPTYQTVQQQVVCHRDSKTQPKNIDELTKVKLSVPADSAYLERLTELKNQNAKLSWEVVQDTEAEQLLEQVSQRKIECTVADSNVIAISRRFYPDLVVNFNLTQSEPLTWLLTQESQSLDQALKFWFREYQGRGYLEQILQKYYGHIELFDYVDTRTFTDRLITHLPKFRPIFEAVGQKHQQAWTLLAAMAYQESHWNVFATSPTGVRGMMMLTKVTANELGVRDRLDPKQAIEGGARYLASLYKRLPAEVKEPDRTWFALAAYNVGLGHINDARELARERGIDPNLWSDLATTLPLLSLQKYYKRLKHGYARGNEPVRYVSNIRDYHDILEQHLAVQVSSLEKTTKK